MITTLLARTRLLVAALATIGLLVGVVVAYVNLREERFMAQVTLAMLPGPEVPPEEALGFWEVLNRGQATRTAAMTLQDPRWLGIMSAETSVPASEFRLFAGAIPDTTLIDVTVHADSAWAAEIGLNTVVTDGVTYAEKVSGPFTIETVSVEYGQAESMSPILIQQLGALGLAGLLVGAGAGFLISRSAQGRITRRERQATHTQPAATISVPDGEPGSVEGNGKPVSVPNRAP